MFHPKPQFVARHHVRRRGIPHRDVRRGSGCRVETARPPLNECRSNMHIAANFGLFADLVNQDLDRWVGEWCNAGAIFPQIAPVSAGYRRNLGVILPRRGPAWPLVSTPRVCATPNTNHGVRWRRGPRSTGTAAAVRTLTRYGRGTLTSSVKSHVCDECLCRKAGDGVELAQRVWRQHVCHVAQECLRFARAQGRADWSLAGHEPRGQRQGRQNV